LRYIYIPVGAKGKTGTRVMAQTSLPPGFRFHPTDVELVSYYLKRKIMGKKLIVDAISEVDLYKFPPWDLPGNPFALSFNFLYKLVFK